MTFVAFRAFVGVVVAKHSITTDFAEMETVIPSTWICFGLSLADSDADNVAVFDILPVFDCRVGRNPS